MTIQPYPENGPVTIVDCPLCDAPAAVDTALCTLECAACGVRLELAEDHAPDVLATAA
jgi:hypothetical protein